ncbi:MAG: cache domain-containing protein [Nitrospirae bacterium]|nr:cache domain-containing protein [Nitrospirota bacterium]
MKVQVKEMLKFGNLPMFWKISFFPQLAVSLVMIGLFAYILPLTKNKLMSDKRESTANIVRIAYSMVAEYDKRIAKGEFTPEEGKRRAIERIRNFKYGNDGKGYLWINDLEPKMIMHPAKPELDGKNLSDYKDPTGKAIFVEFVKAVKNNGEGFVEYMWPKPGEAEPKPKLSFVKIYQPWGWVIGSGIYIDDVMQTVMNVLYGIAITMIIVSVVLITATIVLGGRYITGPIKGYGKMMQDLSSALSVRKGNLTGRMKIKGKDEIGHLADDINKFLDSYGEMVESMLTSTGKVVTTTDVLKDNANNMTSGAQKQTSQAYQIAAASEQMSKTINDIAKNASQASETSREAMKFANEGKEIAQGAVQTVNQVHISTTGLADMIAQLDIKSAEIGNIVTVIKDIADQTNLLALNAAIEAARAGEQGRGFAVVADEVRKLAERTIKATNEITEKIQAIQQEAGRTNQSMQGTAEEVIKADASIKDVMSALEGIAEAVMKSNDQMTQIAAGVEEQSAAAEEVTKNIENTTGIAKETEHMASEVLKATNRIIDVVEDLRKSFIGFRTKGSAAAMIEVAKSDLRSFMYKLGDSVNGTAKLTEANLPDENNCRFGKWYHSDGMEILGHLESYKRLNGMHKKIHALSREIIASVNKKDGREAALYKDLADLVNKVQADMDAIKIESLKE